MDFFTNKFLPIFPIVVFWLIYIWFLIAYFKKEWLGRLASLKILLIFTAAFRVFHAGLLSVTQYYVWSGSELTKALINSPISPEVPLSNFLHKSLGFVLDSKFGYFLFYSWGRFWVNVLLTIVISLAFYIFLKALKRYNDRFFNEGEVELGFLLAMIVGWPNFIIFIPLVFGSVVLVSIFRGFYFKEAYTTLGVPMILAALVIMIFGNYFINFLGLTVFKI